MSDKLIEEIVKNLNKKGNVFEPDSPKEEKKSFCCPICGSREYEIKTRNNGIYGPGGRSWVDYCICEGCSVVFKEPEKFTRSETDLK